MEHTDKKTFRDSALRAIAVIGLVAILLLGAWGIIQIAFVLPGFFTNIFGAKVAPLSVQTTQESVAVATPATITSGQPFALEWAHQNATDTYAYQISYSCADGLTMHAPTPAGSYQSVPCNTSFNFTNAAKTVQLTPTLSSKTNVPATFTVFATRLSDGVVTAVGSTTATILPAASVQPTAVVVAPAPAPVAKKAAAPVAKPTPASVYTPANRTSNLYGSPDLIVAIGSVQPTGGRYTLKFVVTNVGTNVSAAGWTLTASLPLNPVYNYVSGPQPGMYPGDTLAYTMVFDAPANTYATTYGQTCGTYPYTYDCGTYNPYTPYATNRTVSITIDPQNYTAEYNKANNTATTQI